MIKAIKTDEDLSIALKEIERLMDIDPDLGMAEAEELEILTILVEDYERKKVKNLQVDPIDAIVFRMEQQNLTQRDLIPFIGSRSKVSEVLSRKRPLTLSMIRALHNGLGIPAKSLLQEQDPIALQDYKIEWDRFPVKEMVSRGWLDTYLKSTTNNIEILKKFFDDLKPIPIIDVMYRQSNYIRSARKMNRYALAAWTARIISLAQKRKPKGKYKKGKIDVDFMRGLVRLSMFDKGPVLACEYLDEQGVSVVIEPHLSNTYLDGTAILMNLEYPVIGLTLRHDRIDNFWFTLMHELAHVCLHLDKGVGQFYDDLDLVDQNDLREDEADALANEALIPEVEWRKSPASKLKSPDAVQHLANKLAIHPAIVAGRIRHKFKDYRVLSQLVGHNKVASLFGVKK
jgi:HTH-type transcriptional regulator/antitoxin HigA